MGDLIDAELQDHPTGKELVEDAKQSTMDKAHGRSGPHAGILIQAPEAFAA